MKTFFFLLVSVAFADDDPAASLERLRGEPRRAERRDVIAVAEAADRLAAGGSESAWRLAGDLYLHAYRAFRQLRDLTTALDRLEHAAGAEGAGGCEAALAVARVHAELASLEAGFLAFHRALGRCGGSQKEAAERAIRILAAFRPDEAALAAVDRDPAAPIPAQVARASRPPADAGPVSDAAAAAPPPDAAPRAKRPGRMSIRFSDAGAGQAH
jgi:hypothetical protein